MSHLSERLTAVLEEKGISYRSVPHSPDYTSQETAEHTETPGEAFAKTVIVRVDGKPAMAVLPADRKVDLEKLRRWLDADEVRLATEQEMKDLFPDCEIGAEPPLGNLYGIPVYVSPLLSRATITFNGGNHDEAVRMRYGDFAELVKPAVIDFVEP